MMIVLIACLYGLAVPAQAQGNETPPGAPTRLRVFLDCPPCDSEYLRQSIAFIDYISERTAADLHVLVLTQPTGGGGMAWTVKFIGQSWFEGRDRTLTFTTPQLATSDNRRREFARVFRIGLVGYAAETSVASELDVTWGQAERAVRSRATEDPWNFWVFRLGANGNLGGESSRTDRSYRFSFSGSRTTEQWKINLSTSSFSSNSVYRVSDEVTIKGNSNGWNLGSLVVKSLGTKWSVGNRTQMSHSSFSNTDRSTTVAPALEYDFFPYSESSRRSFTLQYSVGATKYNYREVTIFDKLNEMVPHHALNASLGLRAPWGSVGGTLDISQHLNQTNRHRVSLYATSDVRLYRGFAFNVIAQSDRIRDQIGLRRGDATTEEVLLRLRQLATGYSYYVNFGITYSFGSIFNSTVNPRFGRSAGAF